MYWTKNGLSHDWSVVIASVRFNPLVFATTLTRLGNIHFNLRRAYCFEVVYCCSCEWFLKYFIIFKNDLQYLHLRYSSHVNYTSYNLNVSWVLDSSFTNCCEREFQMFLLQYSSGEAANCVLFPASCSVQNYWRANWLWTLLLIGLSGQLYQRRTNRHNNRDLLYPCFIYKSTQRWLWELEIRHK